MGLFDKIKNFVGREEPSSVFGSNSSERTPASDAEAGNLGAALVDSSDLLERLKQKLSELSNGQLTADAIDSTASLFDFGYLDSLSAVTMISFIETEYGVSVSEIDLVGELDHLHALADRVARDRTR
jgi:acyl carrier protein